MGDIAWKIAWLKDKINYLYLLISVSCFTVQRLFQGIHFYPVFLFFRQKLKRT